MLYSIYLGLTLFTSLCHRSSTQVRTLTYEVDTKNHTPIRGHCYPRSEVPKPNPGATNLKSRSDPGLDLEFFQRISKLYLKLACEKGEGKGRRKRESVGMAKVLVFANLENLSIH